MAKVDSISLTVIIMLEILKKDTKVVMDKYFLKVELNSVVSGKMIGPQVKDKWCMQMGINFQEII